MKMSHVPRCAVTVTLIAALTQGACATGGQGHLDAPTTMPAPSEDIGPRALLDAQLEAIRLGDAEGASAAFSSSAIFSGPGVDEVATDSEAKALATQRFEALAEAGFSPTKPLVLIGGEDTPRVRWAAYRFGSKGQAWTVTTLLSGPSPWRIVAQSWDKPEEDQRIVSNALKGTLPSLGHFDDSLGSAGPKILAWVDAKRTHPTDLSFSAASRGDTFGIGSAGEYAQSDEALLIMQAEQRRLFEAGHLRIDPMHGAGRLVRLSPDGAAGVALYHTGVIIETPHGEVTLPMRTISYFLLQPSGPRLVGGHFMATP